MINKDIKDYAVIGYMEHMLMLWKEGDQYKYVEHNIEQTPNFSIGEALSFQEVKDMLRNLVANGWIVYNCAGECQFLYNVGDIVIE